MDASKWGFAVVLACPPCTAGLFLATAATFGITAALFKGALLVGLVSVLGLLWARNIWRRRDECRLPEGRGRGAPDSIGSGTPQEA